MSIIGTLPPWRGVSDNCLNQLIELQKLVPVDFFSFQQLYPEFLYPGKSAKEEGLIVPPLLNTKIHSQLTWWNPLTWIRAGFQTKGEVLHYHYWTFFLFHVIFTVALISKLRGKKIVGTIHNANQHGQHFLPGFFARAYEWVATTSLLAISDRVIVYAAPAAEAIEKSYHYPRDKIDVIPMGTIQSYNQKLSRADSRKKLGIPAKAYVLLFFGNIRPYKGLDDLIDAYNLARKKNPNLFLLIAGQPWNEKEATDLRARMVSIPNVRADLAYIPSQDVATYYSAADLVVLPYRAFTAQSGPGNIGLAFEKPLLVTNVGGLASLVKDPSSIVEPGNVSQLAERIVQISQGSKKQVKLLKDSKELNKKNSWKETVSRMMVIYQALTK